MRIPLATDLKTRTGVPDKDARLKNSYIETRGDQSVVRKRPIAQGGVSVGTGIAQGGINFNGLFLMNGDVLAPYTGGGTNWNSGTTYAIGDMVSVGFVDYWAITSNTNSMPPNGNWSPTYIPPVPAPPVTYATFDPLHKGTQITLSNGNLTASISGTISDGSVRSTISKSSGKWYWELTVNAFTNTINDMTIGVQKSTAYMEFAVGWDASGWAYLTTPYDSIPVFPSLNSAIVNSGGFLTNPYGVIYTVSDVIGVALDMDAGNITFYKNGVSQGLATLALSGNIFAAFGARQIAANANTVTANFGATPFVYSVPAGYNHGLYV